MLKTKTVRIDERTFTVKELPVKVVRELIHGEQAEQPMLEQAKRLLQLSCPELTTEILWEMYPSEIEELWRAFEEVNASFLGVIRTFELDRILIETMREFVTGSMRQFAASSPPDTDQLSGNTDSASF
ncbi:MAG: hypothetical protein ACOX5Z_00205 [Desulfobulbus sp.]